jgi:clan AA aspartic protease (TIGR02281 family)
MRLSVGHHAAWLCTLMTLLVGFSSAGSGQPAGADATAATMSRLSIDLPANVARTDAIRKPLEELGREPCDQDAIDNLGRALEKIGYRREAATAQVRYSETCGGHAPSLRSAVNVLLKLSDYSRAAEVATDLIKLDPFNDNGYFLRAVAYDHGGAPRKAIDDYVTAIELFGMKDKISSAGYLGMARNYEKLNLFCDAIVPIEAWVALNPARNDTSQTRAIIADYTAKGKCAAATGKEEVFRISRSHGTVKVPVAINGVRGTMILDTGATFVTLTAVFAQRAKVQIDQDSRVKMHTANGIIEVKRGRAATIQLRSLQAKDVPIVVQTDAKQTSIDGTDGLLGMSFLSRFKVSIDAQAVTISGRRSR